MGSCCSKVDSSQINIKEQIFLKKSVSRLNVANKFKAKVDNINIFNYDNDKSSFQGYINQVVYKYKLIYANKIFCKINLEQIWNISKYYNENHTESNYVLFDLRKKKGKNPFLAHYNSISYTLNQISIMTQERINTLIKYINNKTLLLILDFKETTEILDYFFEVILQNKEVNTKFLFVNFCFDDAKVEVFFLN